MKLGTNSGMPVKLVDIDISEPLPAICRTNGHSRIWILVKSEGIPLGYARLQASSSILQPDRLAREISIQCGENLMRHSLYRQLVPGSELFTVGIQDRFHEEDAPNQPYVSVLVCTRDRADSLVHTLDSLIDLDYSRLEVIVVDNAPSIDETERQASRYPFRYVVEPRPGLDWARNRAISESQGEIVAFIDDDAMADPTWLRGLARGFADPDVMCVTGLTVPAELETRAQELFEMGCGGFGRGFVPKTYGPGNMRKCWCYWPSVFGSGCNMAFRREVFDRVGMFDVALDVGTVTGGGGDLDMFHRLARAGCTIAYSPDALVRHRHREGMEELRKLLANYGKSFTAFLTKCLINEPEARLYLAPFIVKWYLRWFGKRAVRRILGREVMPLRLIATEALGSLHGPYAYLRAIRNAEHIRETYSVIEELPERCRQRSAK